MTLRQALDVTYDASILLDGKDSKWIDPKHTPSEKWAKYLKYPVTEIYSDCGVVIVINKPGRK